ncbi:MAG: hypothetical protein FWD14_01135 [Treponema sp.]|nr:hypothetical protein [Treponema sp.]
MKRRRNAPFRHVGAVRAPKTAFNLSYEKVFTCDMGQLIPVLCDEALPGDVWHMSNEIVARLQPLVAPILHEINIFTHTFFVPYRLLWEDWEQFITGGEDGEFVEPEPRWEPSRYIGQHGPECAVQNKLWDFMGLPVTRVSGVPGVGALGYIYLANWTKNCSPLIYPKRAYNLIFNEYYRDQNLQDEVEIDQEEILFRNWEKDYFTSALPWQQKGTAPSLPISGLLDLVYASSGNIAGDLKVYVNRLTNTYPPPLQPDMENLTLLGDQDGNLVFGDNAYAPPNSRWWIEGATTLGGIKADMSKAVSFDISDLRNAFQIQKWLERNARAGSRYTEFLKAHFPAYPRDERLQRPEYIGGSKAPIIVSEVLQTSRSDPNQTPQGTMAGHGISAARTRIGKYRVQEHGLIMTLMSIMPKASYQQGINRQWLRYDKLDHPFIEFVNLSEQKVLRGEIYTSSIDADNTSTFGYQGQYDELRVKNNIVCSEMRDTFAYWHIGRKFSNPPHLNEIFISTKNTIRKDIFAVPSRPGFIISYGNVVTAMRPIPYMSEPGLIDHN